MNPIRARDDEFWQPRVRFADESSVESTLFFCGSLFGKL
jgi:hypothetical protein